MALRPQFSLWQVLEHKRRLEEQIQLRLNDLGRQRTLAEAQLTQHRREAERHRRHLAERERASEVVDLDERRAALAYLDGIERRIEEQTTLMAELDVQAAERRHELVEVLKEKQMLERLQSRQEHAALERQMRREASEQDDLNMNRYTRDQRSGGAA